MDTQRYNEKTDRELLSRGSLSIENEHLVFLRFSTHLSPSPGIQRENHRLRVMLDEESDHSFERGYARPGWQCASQD